MSILSVPPLLALAGFAIKDPKLLQEKDFWCPVLQSANGYCALAAGSVARVGSLAIYSPKYLFILAIYNYN